MQSGLEIALKFNFKGLPPKVNCTNSTRSPLGSSEVSVGSQLDPSSASAGIRLVSVWIRNLMSSTLNDQNVTFQTIIWLSTRLAIRFGVKKRMKLAINNWSAKAFEKCNEFQPTFLLNKVFSLVDPESLVARQGKCHSERSEPILLIVESETLKHPRDTRWILGNAMFAFAFKLWKSPVCGERYKVIGRERLVTRSDRNHLLQSFTSHEIRRNATQTDWI